MSVATALPEAARNVRIQLRPKRMLAAGSICAVVSITAYLYYNDLEKPPALLALVLGVAVTVLTIGGGIYCLQSIHREKELNTFDYQRVTRLTPMELAVGKLFGAPSLMYFIALCLVPITVLAAMLSNLPVTTLLWIYVILLLGSITWHAGALLVSLQAGRGTSAGTILIFLFLVLFSLSGEGNRTGMLAFRGVSPYFVAQLPNGAESLTAQAARAQLPPGQDLVFGLAVPHVQVLTVLYLSLTAWFLLALVRNIKRDPAVYEIYSPAQAFGLVLYLDAIVLAFFQWTRVFPTGTPGGTRFEERLVSPAQAENEFLTVSLWFFVIFALALLRNRERVRGRVLALGQKAAGWWAALWPAPYLLAGILTVGLAMIATVRYKLNPGSEWSVGAALFEVCFLAAWIIRDALFLQWMHVRRGRRPLMMGMIYLAVFYICSSALFAASGLYRTPSGPLRAYLTPWSIFAMNFDEWRLTAGMWTGALILLLCEALVFAALQRQQLMKLRASAEA